MFRNREEAGRLLAQRLRLYAGQPGVVLAVPRGGIVVGYVVAKELQLPLELMLAKKIGHPANHEYAIGAAGIDDVFIVPHAGVSESYIKEEVAAVRERLREMQRLFLGDRRPAELAGKTVIVVDDGIATGNTLIASLKMLRRKNPARIVIAVPVAPGESIRKLRELADEVIALIIPLEFYGVGSYYEDFEQVNDAQVMAYLKRAHRDYNAAISKKSAV